MNPAKWPTELRKIQLAPTTRAISTLIFGVGVLALVVACLLPGRDVPELMNDKLEHFTAYFMLGFAGLVMVRSRQGVLLLFGFLCLLSIALELGQKFSLGRTPDARDAAAGWAGAAFSLLPCIACWLRLKYARPRAD